MGGTISPCSFEICVDRKNDFYRAHRRRERSPMVVAILAHTILRRKNITLVLLCEAPEAFVVWSGAVWATNCPFASFTPAELLLLQQRRLNLTEFHLPVFSTLDFGGTHLTFTTYVSATNSLLIVGHRISITVQPCF